MLLNNIEVQIKQHHWFTISYIIIPISGIRTYLLVEKQEKISIYIILNYIKNYLPTLKHTLYLKNNNLLRNSIVAIQMADDTTSNRFNTK